MTAPDGLRIIDGHAHVASMQFVPEEFVAGAAANIAAGGLGTCGTPTPEQIKILLMSQYQDDHADRMVAAMDAAGVERTVLLVPDFTHALQCSLTIEEMALRHHSIKLRHPSRFHVFQGIDPRGGKDALDFFESTILDYGFDGLKLYPPCGYSPSDARLFPFYEICRDFALPVLLHTGPTSPVLDFEFARPALIDRAARVFPDVNFILAHGGVNHTEDASLLCAYRPNVYLDIAGFPTTLRPRGWQEHLRGLFSLGINHKIIFGTDWPLSGLTMTIRDCVHALTSTDGPMAELPPRDVGAIFHDNMDRMLTARSGRCDVTVAAEALPLCN